MDMKLVALIVMALNMIWDIFLSVLDRRSLKRPIPVCVADVYDPETYRKWRAYKSETSRLGTLEGVTGYLVNALLIVFDAYAAFARLFPENMYTQLFSVILLYTLVSELVELPFSAYGTFRVEEKFGFNKSTVKTFAGDAVKGLVIGLALVTVLASLCAWIHSTWGSWVVPAIAAVIVLVGLLITLLYPYLSRISNKFVPLEEGELRQKLTALMDAHGYRVRAIEVMDASKRTTKVNAYFTGFGPLKSIVLYDTLLKVATPDQLCAVFAHELGHGLHHDTLKGQLIAMLQAVVTALIVWALVSVPSMYADFGFSGLNYGMAFVLLNAALGLLSPLLGLAASVHSRRAEYRADAQAVAEGYGDALVDGLKVLARTDLADLSPDPLLVRLTYSHPTLAQRIEAIGKASKKG